MAVMKCRSSDSGTCAREACLATVLSIPSGSYAPGFAYTPHPKPQTADPKPPTPNPKPQPFTKWTISRKWLDYCLPAADQNGLKAP